MTDWTLADARQLCEAIEKVCTPSGCHVALTGGVLYKDGPRKDLDLLFYRVRQLPQIDRPALFAALDGIGLKKLYGFGWCYKAVYQGKRVDLFFPDQAWSMPPERWAVRMARKLRQAVGMSA
jgi:hypothetical protein